MYMTCLSARQHVSMGTLKIKYKTRVDNRMCLLFT